jgi:hypothetical protein
MDPTSWPTATDPYEMLAVIHPQRNLDSDLPQSNESRLYLLACARQAWDRLPGVCRVAARLAERVYGGRIKDRRLRDQVYPHVEALTHCRGEAEEVNAIAAAFVRLGLADQGLADPAEVFVSSDIPAEVWSGFAHLVFLPFYRDGTPNYRLIPRELHSADLIREVFGNPFRREPPLDPCYLNETVLQLTARAEEEDDFSVYPILADALQDAGCERSELLAHLRSPGPHVRGCWALRVIRGEC